jgi:hypothetical protein
VNDHVGGLFQNIAGARGDFHAPRRVAGAHYFTQIAANLCGVRIDCAADFDGLFFTHQPRDGGTNGADTILYGANLLLHRFLRLPLAAGETLRLLAPKENLTIKEFGSVGNAKRDCEHPMGQCGGCERKIMKTLIAFVLLWFIATAEVAAQEVSVAGLASASSVDAAFPAPQPKPRPQTIRDDAVKDSWELGFGYAFVRFRSSPFNATMSGLNTTVSYYVRDHFALEGNVTATFSEDARYVFYGGGVKVSKGNRNLQPFAHALVGGVHMFPQTAFSNNGFAVELGGGAERRLRPQIWLRFEVDYVRSQLYSAGQNNFQTVAAINYRF